MTCILMILDGWGIDAPGETNAVSVAKTPFLDHIMAEFPGTQLACSGEAVGLPDGIMGNSEVGHLNLGAGRVVYQVLLRIDMAVKDGSFFENEALNAVMDRVNENQSALHLMGLVSDGGVHSQLTHLNALTDMAEKKGISRVYIHAILDGRDTPPDSGVTYINQLGRHISDKPGTQIASICGRFYAMDRDTRWERTEKAYRLYTEAAGISESDPAAAVKNAYSRGETDEFVEPVVITDDAGNPLTTVKDNDGIIFFNFRPDRARQITRAFTDPEFREFERKRVPDLCEYVCMAQYDESFTLPVAFPPLHLDQILGEVVSYQGLNQLRIAETEKYAHVTYFFNGGEETPFANEDRHLVPSPREVNTYDEKPEMSAYEVADQVVSYLKMEKYDLMVINFANPDMVGHTGVMGAAVKACETVDRCAEKVVTAALEKDAVILVTADHGNSEKMVDENGQKHTAHTLNPVPLILVSKDDSRFRHVRLRSGVLGDIAPTILEIMGIEKPERMTGKSLMKSFEDGH
ncbi:MAG: 2,3-bisphosphoglycerate-independent phosphoglycerate mutase [Desulfobacterales bacterium]|nr:2,3-bisphosphoglycerate-independent phosphoglycerate mutase [Desulfobacterales bacterium]